MFRAGGSHCQMARNIAITRAGKRKRERALQPSARGERRRTNVGCTATAPSGRTSTFAPSAMDATPFQGTEHVGLDVEEFSRSLDGGVAWPRQRYVDDVDDCAGTRAQHHDAVAEIYGLTDTV